MFLCKKCGLIELFHIFFSSLPTVGYYLTEKRFLVKLQLRCGGGGTALIIAIDYSKKENKKFRPSEPSSPLKKDARIIITLC